MLGASFISLAAAALLYKPLLAVNVHVYATPLAHMPVFALGMYFAFGHTGLMRHLQSRHDTHPPHLCLGGSLPPKFCACHAGGHRFLLSIFAWFDA